MSNQNRVPAGVRTGGQFTHGRRGPAGVHLDAHPDPVDGDPWSQESPTPPDTTLPVLEQPMRTIGGVPAVVAQTHRAGGVRADWPDGTPADLTFHEDGSIASWRRAGDRDRSYFQAGGTVCHVDPRDSSHVAVSPNDGGRCTQRGLVVRRVSSVPSIGRDGGIWQQSPPKFAELRDGPGGEPAVVYTRADGSVSSLTRYRDGRWTHTVDFDRSGEPVVVFTNSQLPAVQGFPADDPVWTDLGLDGDRWAGTRPHDALLQDARAEGDTAADSRAAAGWPPPGPMPTPEVGRAWTKGDAVRLPRRPAGMRADQMDAWDGEAADWYGGEPGD